MSAEHGAAAAGQVPAADQGQGGGRGAQVGGGGGEQGGVTIRRHMAPTVSYRF